MGQADSNLKAQNGQSNANERKKSVSSKNTSSEIDLKPSANANNYLNNTDENVSLQRYPSTYGKSLQNKTNKYFADNTGVMPEHRRIFSEKENVISKINKRFDLRNFIFRCA